jgi:hypothetical protein
VAIGIAAMMIPGGSLVSTAFADSSASGNIQSNSASNTATVHISNGGHHNSDNKSGRGGNDNNHKSGAIVSHSGNVDQSISQSNSISASNSGSGGSAFADFNSQSNDASNSADVSIHNHGNHGKISHSGNVDQSITQSNDIQASNSGSGGSAFADFNTQSNDASNTASVDISNSGHGSISHSGNVEQSISQSNSINATSTSPPPITCPLAGCG